MPGESRTSNLLILFYCACFKIMPFSQDNSARMIVCYIHYFLFCLSLLFRFLPAGFVFSVETHLTIKQLLF